MKVRLHERDRGRAARARRAAMRRRRAAPSASPRRNVRIERNCGQRAAGRWPRPRARTPSGSSPSGHAVDDQPAGAGGQLHFVGQRGDAAGRADAAHGAVGDDQAGSRPRAGSGARCAPGRPRCRSRCGGSCARACPAHRAARCWRNNSSPGLRAGPSRSGRSRLFHQRLLDAQVEELLLGDALQRVRPAGARSSRMPPTVAA